MALEMMEAYPNKAKLLSSPSTILHVRTRATYSAHNPVSPLRVGQFGDNCLGIVSLMPLKSEFIGQSACLDLVIRQTLTCIM